MAIFYPTGGAGGKSGSDDCTATRAQLLNGYTGILSDTDDEPAAGTMPNNGAVNANLNAGQSKVIPAGYTSGGTVRANSLASQTQATAAANRIQSGYSAWVNGVLVWGTLQVQSAINFNIAAVSYNSIRISWTNPAVGPWAGVFIQMSTGGYPGQQGGSRVYSGVGSNAAAGAYSEVIIGGLSANTTYYFTCSSYADPLPWGAGVNLSARTADSKVYVANNAVIGADTTFGPFVIDERCHLHVSYYYDSGGRPDRRKWFMGRGPADGRIGFIGDSPFYSVDHPHAETIYGDAGQSGDLSWDLPSYMGQTFYICFMPSSDTDHRNLTINYIYYDIV